MAVAGQRLAEIMDERRAAFARRDWAAYKAGLATDAVYVEVATGATARGADAFVEAVKGWTETYPDLRATVDAVYVCGSTVVAELTWAGTQTGALRGPFGTIPPSGKSGTVRAVQVTTFAGEQITEVHHYFDAATILREIGVLAIREVAPVAGGSDGQPRWWPDFPIG